MKTEPNREKTDSSSCLARADNQPMKSHYSSNSQFLQQTLCSLSPSQLPLPLFKRGSLFLWPGSRDLHMAHPWSLQFSSVTSDSLWPHGLQHARLPCPLPTPRACSNSCPSSRWYRPTILSSIVPFSSCHQSCPALGSFSMSQFFAWPKYWGFSFSISPSDEYLGLIFFRVRLVWSPCSPRDSQESSPTPQFKSINFSVLSFLYCPTLTSISDYWKNHSFD